MSNYHVSLLADLDAGKNCSHEAAAAIRDLEARIKELEAALQSIADNSCCAPCRMTLRDYFAAAAMQGVLAQSEGSALTSNPNTGAKFAYRIADAMMEHALKHAQEKRL